MSRTKPRLFFVDDEPQVRKAVKLTLEGDFNVTCFALARECLDVLDARNCDILVTDVNMPGMDGIELLAHARRRNPALPVVIVTGYGDIPMAVRAVKAGAAEFVEKPLDQKTLLPLLHRLVEKSQLVDPRAGRKLSRTERIVLRLTIAGKSSKEIAHLLGRSVRTVEDHRSHIMRKFGVHNVVDLVRLAISRDGRS